MTKTIEEQYGDILDQVIAVCTPFYNLLEAKTLGRRELPQILETILELVLNQLDPAMSEQEIRNLREYFVRARTNLVAARQAVAEPPPALNLPTATDTGWYNFPDGSAICPEVDGQRTRWVAVTPARLPLTTTDLTKQLFDTPLQAAAALARHELGPAKVRLSEEHQNLWAVLQMESYSVRGLLSTQLMRYDLRARALLATVQELRQTAMTLESIALQFRQGHTAAQQLGDAVSAAATAPVPGAA